MTIGAAFLARGSQLEFTPIVARPIPFRLGADDTYSTTTKKFGTASIYVGADNSSPTGVGESAGRGNAIESEPTTLLNLGTGDFTIECWVYPEDLSDSSDRFVIEGRAAETEILAGSAWSVSIMEPAVGGGLRLVSSGGNYLTSNVTVQHTSANVTVNAWNHIAFTRSGTTLRSFINGNLCGTTSSFTSNLSVDSAYLTSTGFLRPYPCLIMPSYTVGGVDGYIDSVKISNVARYTASFTISNIGEAYNDANSLFVWTCNQVTAEDMTLWAIPPGYVQDSYVGTVA